MTMKPVGIAIQAVLDEVHAMDQCRTLMHPPAYLAKRLKQNGSHEIVDWCPTCEQVVTYDKTGGRRTSYSKQWLEEQSIAFSSLPEVADRLRYRRCFYCHHYRLCEMHHTHPREIYAADADKHPIVPACKECHQEQTAITRQRLARVRRSA
jgi:hypothetical protein